MNPIIDIPAEETYSIPDIVDRLVPLVDGVAHHRAESELRYSASDIYWLLRDMLKRANKDIEGEFYMQRLKKGDWRLAYRRRTADEQKADMRHKRQVDDTKKLIERLKF